MGQTVDKNLILEKLIDFRKNMDSTLFPAMVEKIWGTNYLKIVLKNKKYSDLLRDIPTETLRIVDRKVRIVHDGLQSILVKDWVKFVAITGSVGARICQDDDDIDIFIVVKNNRLWLYRFAMWIKTIGRVKLSREKLIKINSHKDRELAEKSKLKDFFCINFITEERILTFDPQDIFTMHEIYEMIPVFGHEYFDKILLANSWLNEKYGAQLPAEKSISSEPQSKAREFVVKSMNKVAFFGQLLYMRIHGVSFRSAIDNARKGWFVSYPQDSRKRLSKARIKNKR